jgi:hypothetical protein
MTKVKIINQNILFQLIKINYFQIAKYPNHQNFRFFRFLGYNQYFYFYFKKIFL